MTATVDDRNAEASPLRGCVSAVIATRDSGATLPGLLDSLWHGFEGLQSSEVVVVDMQSSDGSRAIATAHPIGARVMGVARSASYAHAVNVAAAVVSPDRHILLLDPSVRPLSGSVRALSDRLETEPCAGVVVPRLLNEDGTLAWSIRREPSILTAWSEAVLGSRLSALIGAGERLGPCSLYSDGGTVDWAVGGALMIAARARQRVPSWDESYFFFSEELDYMRRVRQAGMYVKYVPDAWFSHIHPQTAQSHPLLHPLLRALFTRNRLRYFRRHHGVVASTLFWLAVTTGEALRCLKCSSHRAALGIALGVAAVRPGQID
jgi:N-acetylglucosaminyl-diphospho-decaprenol L-rhamnosyltransferase